MGYFRFGWDTICFGQLSSGDRAEVVTSTLHDALQDVRIQKSKCFLPFNPTNLVDNLRRERYVNRIPTNESNRSLKKFVRDTYYFVRPALPVFARKLLQRASLRGWDQIAFPEWPVDFTVERILQRLLVLSMKARGIDRLPFIWFWPDGCSACAIITHDVETEAGLNYCLFLMDTEDSLGIKASYQIIPEKRYRVSKSTLSRMRDKGCEINVHDLNHDGHLYRNRSEFLRRVEKINEYGRDYGASGFRSAVLYRNLDWYDALDFSYDMSVPNIGNLDPQRGGCCTVMPYFVGKILELPLTTIQDYSLFYLLGNYSIDLWKKQIGLILKENGLMSFNIHPDYVRSEKGKNAYTGLLKYLSQLRSEEKIWMALPKDVDRWWRARSQMTLVDEGDSWAIEGPSKERAGVAYAMLDGDEVVYALPEVSRQGAPV